VLKTKNDLEGSTGKIEAVTVPFAELLNVPDWTPLTTAAWAEPGKACEITMMASARRGKTALRRRRRAG